jgi:hypothetical protein
MVVTALLLGVLLPARIAVSGGPSGPVVAGGALFVGPGHPKELEVVEDSTGYDGQFVYRLSLDPLSRREKAYGITLDNPPYRQQRIVLPVVAWAVNRSTRLPLSWTLLLVNALGLVAAAWAAAVLARRLGRNALWGVAVGLAPGLVVAVCRDLTEPLAAAFLLWGFVWWAGRRTPLALVAFALSALTRETALAPLLGLGIYETYVAIRGPNRLRALGRTGGLLAVLAVFAAWQVHLKSVWGVLPFRATHGDIGTPVVHTFRYLFAQIAPWTVWSTKDAILNHIWVGERLVLLAIVVATGYAAVRGTTDTWLKAAWATGTLLAFTATWNRDIAFLRVANESVLAGTFVLLGSRTRVANLALATTCCLSLVAAVMTGVVV